MSGYPTDFVKGYTTAESTHTTHRLIQSFVRRGLISASLLVCVSSAGGTRAALSAPFSDANRQAYSVVISLCDENGTPSRPQYRVGDNVWLKIAITNLSTDVLKVPRGEDYTRPRVKKDGFDLRYKIDVSSRIRRNESEGSYVATGNWLLKPRQTESDIVDLGYWYDLQPGSYQVYVERLGLEHQSTQSDSVSFEVLPALQNPASDSAIAVRAAMPPYPAIAAAWAVSGTVLVDVQIDPNGRVASANVASGPKPLRQPATDAARRWLFNSVDSSAGSRSVRLTFIFHELSHEWKEEERDFSPPYQMSVRWAGIPLVKDETPLKASRSLLKRTVSAASTSNDYAVAISPVSLSDVSPPVARTQYRSGDSVGLRITETNLSTDTRNVPLGEDYVRPRLLKDGLTVSYRKPVEERIAKLERGSPYRYGGVMFLRPHQPQSDVIDLSYWYEPLQPGSYQVSVERFFSNGKERIRTPFLSKFFPRLRCL